MLDLRVAVRSLVKAPTFAVLTVLLIALATGLNTALFSLLYASVLRPFPYENASRLVNVFESEAERRALGPLTPANFDDVRRDATSFDAVTGYRYHEHELSGVEPPQRVTALHVLNGFFALLDSPPLIGRTFGDGDYYRAARTEDGLWSVGHVVVLSHGFWRRQFGGARDVVGRTVRLGEEQVVVIGVMREGFDALWREADVYLPWILPPEFWSVRPPHVLPMLARLSPTASVASAQAEVDTIYARLADEYPETNEVVGGAVQPLRDVFGTATRVIFVLFAGAVLVLVVACANLAGLLTTRARTRVREIAVRRALGATGTRITWQLIVENTVVAAIGAMLGVAVAHAALRLVSLPMSLPFAPELSVPVLGFSIAVFAVTVLSLGLAPSWLVSRTDLASSIRGGSKGAASSRAASAFVIVQLGVAMGLVSAGGLLVRSLDALETEPLGFDASRRLFTAYVTLPEARYPDEGATRRFRRRALAALETIPGVSAAVSASHLPTTPMLLNFATAIEGRPLPRGTLRAAPVFVSREYFRTLGIPIRNGRPFDARDTVKSPWVIVVNETMAAAFWPDEDALGKRIRLEYSWAPDAPLTVVGVAPDVKQEGIGRDVRPAFYILHEQFPQEWFYFVLETSVDPSTLLPVVRSRLAELDPNLPVTDAVPMSERVSRSLAEHRGRTRLVGFYAATALLLASLGIYGMLASAVTQRTRELAIRMALGATSDRIVRLVVNEGVRQLGAGLALGLVLAWFGRRFVASLLYGVEPSDGATLAVTVSLLATCGLAAAIVPAQRAARLEIAERLRQE